MSAEEVRNSGSIYIKVFINRVEPTPSSSTTPSLRQYVVVSQLCTKGAVPFDTGVKSNVCVREPSCIMGEYGIKKDKPYS